MLLRSFYLFIITICSVLIMSSCNSRHSTPDSCTAVLRQCADDEEIRYLNRLFEFFDQKMENYYDCKTTEEGLRHFLSNILKGENFSEVLQPTPDETELIQLYMTSASFKENWRQVESDHYYIHAKDSGEIHIPVGYIPCLENRNKEIKRFFHNISQVGDMSIYLMGIGFWDMIENKTNIEPSVGMGIFLYVYLTELLNSQSLGTDIIED